MSARRPGRKPKYEYWKYGIKDGEKSKILTIRLPKYALERIDKLIKRGVYSSRSEAIHDIIMKSNEDLQKEIAKLKEQLALRDKEIEALRARIRVLESEKEEFVQKYHELLKEHEEVVGELMRLKVGFGAQNEKDSVGVREKDRDLWSLAGEYLKLRENERNTWSERELMRIERKRKQVQEEINAILESLGVVKLSFWRTLNQKGLDEAKKLLKGG